MKEVLSWLVRWASCADSRDFCPTLPALVGPEQKIFLLPIQYFTSYLPHRSAGWAGSRAGSPVS
jgi:hypothetical protein